MVCEYCFTFCTYINESLTCLLYWKRNCLVRESSITVDVFLCTYPLSLIFIGAFHLQYNVWNIIKLHILGVWTNKHIIFISCLLFSHKPSHCSVHFSAGEIWLGVVSRGVLQYWNISQYNWLVFNMSHYKKRDNSCLKIMIREKWLCDGIKFPLIQFCFHGISSTKFWAVFV